MCTAYPMKFGNDCKYVSLPERSLGALSAHQQNHGHPNGRFAGRPIVARFHMLIYWMIMTYVPVKFHDIIPYTRDGFRSREIIQNLNR